MEMVTALFTTVAAGAETAGSSLLDMAATSGTAAAADATAGAGAAAAAGTAAAGTSAAATAASTGLAWQGLQGTLTAGSMLMQGGAAIGALLNGTMQADQAEREAKQQALNIQRDYLVKTGAARVAFAGSGVQIGSGSEAASEASLADQASLQEQLAEAGGAAKAQAAQLSGIMGAAASGAGVFKTGADYQISIAKRGLA
jgi:hypothetical protein